MGGRCQIYGQVRAVDWPKFCEILDLQEDSAEWDTNTVVSFSAEEMNWGARAELQEAADAKLVFHVINEPGGSYGYGLTISIGNGEMYEHECNKDGFLTVEFRGDDPPDLDAHAHALRVWRADKRFDELVKEVPDGVPE